MREREELRLSSCLLNLLLDLFRLLSADRFLHLSFVFFAEEGGREDLHLRSSSFFPKSLLFLLVLAPLSLSTRQVSCDIKAQPSQFRDQHRISGKV